MLTLTTLTSVALDVDTVNMKAGPQAVETAGETVAMTEARRPYHHGNLRETLVESGKELARSGGPDAVVLRAVSRQAGVSHNAAYRHFADHDDLLAAVAARCMAELAQLMTTRNRAVRARDPVRRARARLEAIGRAYVEFALTEPGWFRTAFAGHGAQAAAPIAPDEDPYALLSARLDELVAVGALPPERRPGAELAAWSMVHGLSNLLLDGPLRALPPDERDAAVRTALAVVHRGL
jgi:AcrR family transcriptional regulator